MRISEILQDTSYALNQFAPGLIDELEGRIDEATTAKGWVYSTVCLVRQKPIRLTPEEVVRQLYLLKLMREYQYPLGRIAVEYEVAFGREKKRADIVVFDRDRPSDVYILVELKNPKHKEGKEQLKSYCNATGAPIGVWCNGESMACYHRKDPNSFENLHDIPSNSQKLSDILQERWRLADLVENDRLMRDRRSLKDLILEMEDEVLAGAGVDVFEEVFKLVFTKLYDEMESGRRPERILEFRNYGDTDAELYDKLSDLFDHAKRKWPGVFAEDDQIKLTPSHLAICVASLQDVKLFNSNLDVVDEAFEYLINKSSKGEKGQYFTPRYVIDMCVKMLDPKPEETMIDTAAGSCGFPVHTIFHVWQKILESKGLARSHLFTLEEKPAECVDYVQNNVFAIDFDERAVRVARMLNLIAGDGQTNVLHLNTLDYERWDETVRKEEWSDTYSTGWIKLKKLRAQRNSNREFTFDLVMANPPFAGDVKDGRVLARYDLSRAVTQEKLSEKPSGCTVHEGEPTFPEVLRGNTVYQDGHGAYRRAKLKQAASMSRDVLFVERNLDFLKPGGRMAIVLPQGRFNNATDKALREYIADRCRILAVVGLHGNVFKPHTGTKTSVLLVQKWDDTLCPRVPDYNIFFATMSEPSKDSRGDKIYRSAADENGQTVPLLDAHGHLVVQHDLFNHDGLTEDGIAEAFMEFAKREKLSFFADAPSTR
jgi:hypothetical protein